MAPLPVITECYRVALNWRESVSGQIAENVMHVRSATGTALTVAAGVIASFQPAQWYNGVTTGHIESVTVTPLDGSSASVEVDASTGHVIGAQTGDFVPGTSLVVSFHTLKRGRSYRGRFYEPFIADDCILNGSISPGSATQQATAWEAFAAALVLNDMEHVVASYMHSTSENVVAYSIDPACGTQRRRQSRVRYP